MKFLTLLLCAAFYASCIAFVNAKNNGDNKSTMVTVKPTTAPLMSSTAAPTKAPPKHVSPTKPMIARRSQPLTSSTTTTTTTKSPTTKAAVTEKEMKLEAVPLAMPATVETPQKPAELQPLAVTGFITRNGSIYEITDKNGIGQIQSRQANDDDTNAEHVCNYGPVVIYSDVPCDRVTNVKVKEYETKPNVEETSNAPAPAQDTNPTETKPTENANENTEDKETDDKEDLTDMKKPIRRRPNKKRANKNKNTQKQKQQKNKKRNSNQNNQIRYGGNNNKNNKRRRLQQQEQKRRNQQKRRRQQAQQQDNRRKWQYEDEIEEDDYDEPLNERPIRRKPNKSQRRKQAERYTLDYEDY